MSTYNLIKQKLDELRKQSEEIHRKINEQKLKDNIAHVNNLRRIDKLEQERDALTLRICCNSKCNWIGPVTETYQMKHGYPDLLCPECKEVTEEYDALDAINLLRALVKDYQDLLLEIMGARVGYMGSFGAVYSGKKFSVERIQSLYKQTQAAIDGGALEVE